MLYHLSTYLTSYYSFFNVVHYVSVRAIISLLTTLFMSFMLFPWFIRTSKQFFRSKARPWTPVRHRAKDDMPTMGGLLIVGLVILNVLLWCNLAKIQVWIFLACLTLFALLGAWDDWEKIQKKSGISARAKFGLQLSAGLFIILAWLLIVQPSTVLCVPLFKNILPYLGWWLLPWGIFIIIGTSNAANLTDGLDGLAGTSLLWNFATYAGLCYVAGHKHIAQYLHIPFAGSAELTVVAGILVGALLGFLWYNSHPAEIFMGDVGSLSLGAGLGLLALMCRQELLLPLCAGVLFVETLSVIIQVLTFKILGRRVFKMAPLHHHFELLGWQECKITIRFGIISTILSLLALVTLKIR